MKGKSQVPILIVIIFKRITLSYNLVGGIVIFKTTWNCIWSIIQNKS